MSLTPLGVYAAQGAGGAPPATPPTIGGYSGDAPVTTGAITLTTPTCSVGDLLVAVWVVRSNARTPLLPTGWTWLLSSPYTGSNTKQAALYKVADSADSAGGTHLFELNSYGVSQAVAMVSVANCGGVDVASYGDYSTGSTDRAAGTVTPSQANNLLLHMVAFRPGATYTAPASPGSWSVAGQNSLTCGIGIASAAYDSTDATGTVTGTLDTSATGGAFLVACAPA